MSRDKGCSSISLQQAPSLLNSAICPGFDDASCKNDNNGCGHLQWGLSPATVPRDGGFMPPEASNQLAPSSFAPRKCLEIRGIWIFLNNARIGIYTTSLKRQAPSLRCLPPLLPPPFKSWELSPRTKRTATFVALLLVVLCCGHRTRLASENKKCCHTAPILFDLGINLAYLDGQRRCACTD